MPTLRAGHGHFDSGEGSGPTGIVSHARRTLVQTAVGLPHCRPGRLGPFLCMCGPLRFPPRLPLCSGAPTSLLGSAPPGAHRALVSRHVCRQSFPRWLLASCSGVPLKKSRTVVKRVVRGHLSLLCCLPVHAPGVVCALLSLGSVVPGKMQSRWWPAVCPPGWGPRHLSLLLARSTGPRGAARRAADLSHGPTAGVPTAAGSFSVSGKGQSPALSFGRVLAICNLLL